MRARKKIIPKTRLDRIKAGVQEFRSSGVQEFRSSGVQEFRSSGVHSAWKTDLEVKLSLAKKSDHSVFCNS
jgi:hypothetical protein